MIQMAKVRRVENLIKTILLVEDNEMNRDMLSRRLTRKGFRVITAENGQQGVTLTEAERPDLILMDMSLPIMDGWEATRILKNSIHYREIPIIALTAHAMESDKNRAFKEGCDDFDTKPVVLERLLNKMQHLLNRSASSLDGGHQCLHKAWPKY